MKFIGRVRELKELQNLRNKKSASLVVIRGRRRVGKSRLIEEFAKEFSNSYIFSGLPPEDKVTKKIQIEEFILQMRQQKIPRLGSDNWTDLFFDLAQHCQKGPVLIALDEITWMGSHDPAFLGRLKTAWDLHFKKNPQLVLIISGSNSTWIEKNLLSSTGFVGRISCRIKLEELPLRNCRHFFSKHTSPYEVLKILSVTGGIPRYLEEIISQLSPEKNIEQLCFNPSGLLFNEFDQILSSLFSKQADAYSKILHTLMQGSATLKEIAASLDRMVGGDLSESLRELIQSGFIERIRSWNLSSPQKGELYQYRICDNYIRFYLKCIEPQKNLKRPSLPKGWETIIGLQFESLVVNHSIELLEILNIRPEEVLSLGPYFQTETKKRRGCQIDLLIQDKFSTLYLCEVKFSKKELGTSIISEVEKKISRLQRPKSMSIRPVLIQVNGVSDELLNRDFFAHVIDFSDLLSPS